VARHGIFEKVTLTVIVLNVVWMMIDIDFNKHQPPEVQYVIMDNFFCVFFCTELTIRFCAFAVKSDVCRDGWFVFDSFLVWLLVAETWVVDVILPLAGVDVAAAGFGDLAILRLLRLLRLTRIGRLMRVVPELLILIKGMVKSIRSVCLTFVLLFIITYVFAILLKQLAEPYNLTGEPFGPDFFRSVPHTMY
jgi:voltage-gated sodium channel